MTKEHAKVMRIADSSVPCGGITVGWAVRGDGGSGGILVDFPGNSLGPIPARRTASAQAKLREGIPAGCEVLLVFEGDDPGRPIIVDTMHPLVEGKENPVDVVEDEKQRVTLNGQALALDAREEIVLNCGKASITLTKAGKILLKGEYILSRSSGENSIKGASVSIN